jgi:hypothetical protein
MKDAVNFLLSSGDILTNTGSLKFYFDFSTGSFVTGSGLGVVGLNSANSGMSQNDSGSIVFSSEEISPSRKTFHANTQSGFSGGGWRYYLGASSYSDLHNKSCEAWISGSDFGGNYQYGTVDITYRTGENILLYGPFSTLLNLSLSGRMMGGTGYIRKRTTTLNGEFLSSSTGASSYFTGRNCLYLNGGANRLGFPSEYPTKAHVDLPLNQRESGTEFTIIVEGGRIPVTEISGAISGQPLRNMEILFSNKDSQGGFEIGLTSSNKPFISFRDVDENKVFSLNGMSNSENIIVARGKDSLVSLGRYDLSSGIVSQDWYVITGIYGNTGRTFWSLGSGAFEGQSIISTGIGLSENSSSVILRNFMAVEEFLNDDQVNLLCSGLKSELAPIYTVSSGYSITGSTTGTVAYLITGTPFVSSTLSGYTSGSTTTTSTTVTPLYGLVVSGQTILGECGGLNGVLYSEISASAGTQITGYQTGTSVNTIWSTPQPVYIVSLVSGVVSTGYYTLVTPVGGYVTETGVTFELSGSDFRNLYPRTLSYLGDGEEEDFVEKMMGFSGAGRINKMSTRDYVSGSGFGVFLNGQALRFGTGTILTGYVSGQEILTASTDADCFLYGAENTLVLSQEISAIVDTKNFIFDIIETGFQQRIVASTGEYNSGSFTELDILPSKQFYFNGIKLYSGIDFVNSGGKFEPSEALKELGMTGVYFSMPELPYILGNTGVAVDRSDYDNINNSGFAPNTNVVFINGIRKSMQEFAEHGGDVDLLVGYGVYNIEDTGVFSTYLEV